MGCIKDRCGISMLCTAHGTYMFSTGTYQRQLWYITAVHCPLYHHVFFRGCIKDRCGISMLCTAFCTYMFTRDRIKDSCDQLRVLLPYIKGRKTDMASILEMSVEYLRIVNLYMPQSLQDQV
ncbi:hypothetical protein DPMN_147657 [Dreissena polymorpha]|uniref:BHLH domain-containing protein n=1 Tax=Dreissena polymorpha TaxID=45954 RepID=A0A9D4FCL0_DREPO|nr:hypothetical protein DPMN_147657 [Dreissena polymorpha]